MYEKMISAAFTVFSVVLLLNGCASNVPPTTASQSGAIQFRGDTLLKSEPANFARARGIAAAVGATGCNGPVSIFGDLGGIKKSSVIEVWTVSGCGKKKNLKVEITPGQGFEISENK